MKLRTIIILTAFLSNNYVMCQTKCPKNGIQTGDGSCFYVSKPVPKKTCPEESDDFGVIENDADYAIISDLLKTTKTRERVCIWIYDSDIVNILNRQPKYMKILREKNKILLNQPIQDDQSLHIAFKKKNNGRNPIIVIHDSSRNDIHFGYIKMTDDDLQLSARTEVLTSEQSLPPSECLGFYELEIRFTESKLQLFDSPLQLKIVEIDLSLNSKYSANMVSIENVDVYQLEHHDIKCESQEIYCRPIPEKKIDDTYLAKYCFSDYWVHDMTTKVPYQDYCGTERYLNISRIKSDLQKKPIQLLSPISTVSEEEIEKLSRSMQKNLPELNPLTVIVPCLLFVVGLILNLVNVIVGIVDP